MIVLPRPGEESFPMRTIQQPNALWTIQQPSAPFVN